TCNWRLSVCYSLMPESPSKERDEEDRADGQHDGATGRNEQTGRDCETADARCKRDGDTPRKVTSRATRDGPSGPRGHADERLDQERADDLETDDNRNRQQEGKEVFEVRGLGAGDRRKRWVQAVEEQLVVLACQHDADKEAHPDEQREIAVGHSEQAAEQNG